MMADSFPYLNLSRRLGVPYGDVLTFVDWLTGDPKCPPKYGRLSDHDVNAVYATWLDETSRQRKVTQELLNETGKSYIGRPQI